MNVTKDANHKTQSSLNSDGAYFDLSALAKADRLCDWMFDQFPVHGSELVCEIGAGIGTFSERLLASGIQGLHLLEPDPVLFAQLRSRYGDSAIVTLRAEAIPGSAHLRSRPELFDFILCQNVLEHIEDDLGATREMAGALRSGGKLGLLVPAEPRLFGSLDRAFDHHRRYTKERLESLARASGLEVVDLRSFNLLGVLGWWVRSKMRRSSLGQSSLSTYNSLLTMWRPIEETLKPRHGLSLILIAQKPA